ncbi:uncharacterized protein LOC141606653 isoform X2 [Silene latifolia]|uniref:uncharacterized protein LOC141606653 isoform X2 n=1 Tax=Silene latifolia TaxID=37657 RepID=UPI003D789352
MRMMRIGRQIGGLLTKLPTTTKYDDVLLNFLRLRAHHFPSFFCTSNFISQVEQPSILKYPLDKLDDEQPSLDGHCSASSDGECSSSDEECSSSDEEFSSSDGECTSSDGEWDSEEEQFVGYEQWTLDEKSHRPGRFKNPSRGLVVPLVQVYSVSLHTDFDYGNGPCDIYGSIRATNSQGVITNLYMRDIANHETVPNGGSLSLVERFYKFLSYGPTTNTTIDLDLSDKSRNTVLINEKHNLHSFTEEFEDSSYKLIKKIIPGAHCFAVVYYAKFLYAVRAVIKVAIFSKRDTTSPSVDVYGDIAVGYPNARQYCNNDDEVRHMKCTLFSKPFDDPERVMVGTTMRLSRYVVAMPIYSSLVIDADISDSHGRLASGSLEFQTGGQCKKLIDDEFGTIIVIVRLETPYREFIPEVDIREKYVGENDSDALTEDSHDRVKFGEAMLAELFSVYVDGTDLEVAVCGKISVEDSYTREWNMFESNLDTPEFFPQGKGFVTIKGDYPIDCDCAFSIYLYFVDPISTKKLCNKEITYAYIEITQRYGVRYGVRTYTDVPPDKRLCSVFKLGNGYVLLHYIIFYHACQATVEIKFVSDHPSSLPVKIFGSVIASYSNHNYSTMYEKKYYRSRLFDKPQTEFVQLDSDLSLPLSKSIVVVPEGAGLVIEVDLETLSSGNLKDVVFNKKELRINLSRTVCEEIVGKYFRVQISANFKDWS